MYFLVYCNYAHSLNVEQIELCDRCRHYQPPGGPVSQGVTNTTALSSGFHQPDKRNVGSTIALPACYQ